MNRTSRIFLTLALTAGIGRSDTIEPLAGRLENGTTDSVTLTLELPSARLASMADKAGHEEGFSTHALGDLIRERFHYLLRLRIADREFAPTTVAFLAPNEGASPRDSRTLVASWTHPDAFHGQVVTQADSPVYRLALTLVDNRRTTERAASPTSRRPIDTPSAEPWWQTLIRAAGLGFSRLIPGGIEQIFFVLGLCFMARNAGDLFRLVAIFTAAHGLTLALGTAGVVPVHEGGTRWVDAGIALSLVAIALTACFGSEASKRIRLPLVAAFGLLYGLAFARALTTEPVPRMEAHFWPSVVTAHLGIVARQGVVIGVAVLLAGAWRWRRWQSPLYQAGIAVPASVVLGLSGLALTWERMQGAFAVSP